MPTNAEQVATIKSQALANIVAITVSRKPSYTIDGQKVSWTEYLKAQEGLVMWADRQSSGETPLEQHTVGFVT